MVSDDSAGAREIEREASEAMDQLVRARSKELWDRKFDLRQRWRRFLTAGNAGGLVAALSLAGTMMDPAHPELTLPLFVTICMFLAGLGGAGVALWAEQGEYARQEQEIINAAAAEIERTHAVTIGQSKVDWRVAVVHWLSRGGGLLAFVMLFVGALRGVTVLAGFVDWSAWCSEWRWICAILEALVGA